MRFSQFLQPSAPSIFTSQSWCSHWPFPVRSTAFINAGHEHPWGERRKDGVRGIVGNSVTSRMSVSPDPTMRYCFSPIVWRLMALFPYSICSSSLELEMDNANKSASLTLLLPHQTHSPSRLPTCSRLLAVTPAMPITEHALYLPQAADC